jgi:site-specific DNA-methyltransferase (adenine-specific)
MNKGWDRSGIAFQKETWEKCYEVLKPGGYLLAFGGSRTFHRIACAIEDAGFEIRDTIMWLYGSGFPKSMNIAKGIEAKLTTGSANKTQFSELNGQKLERGNWGITKNAKEYGFRKKDYTTETEKTHRFGELEPTTALAKQWQGWGTALKPAHEPIIVARKPFKGSLVDNVIKYGVGGINIDECRIDYNGEIPNIGGRAKHTRGEGYGFKPLGENCVANTSGRFPANVILDEEVGKLLDEQSGISKSAKVKSAKPAYEGESITKFLRGRSTPNNQYDDCGGASRFFYCAKASKKDRDEGLEIAASTINDGRKKSIDNPYQRGETPRKNIHPTVKPCELMQYLIRLVTPKGGIILDPFMGSGSTGKAAMFENRERQAGYKFIGIDLEEEYCNIASARIDYALNKYKYDYQQELKKAKEKGQMSLF